MKNILDEIVRLRTERNWSEYTLAKNADFSNPPQAAGTAAIKHLRYRPWIRYTGAWDHPVSIFAEGFSDQRRTGYAGRMVRPSSSKAPAGGRAAEKYLAALCLDLKTKL